MALGLLAPLAAAELLLGLHRYVGIAPLRMSVDAEHPIARYAPDRRFTWSKGPLLSMANTANSNNVGFISDVDYEADAPGPLFAVVGDSFVEALQVPYRRSCVGRLATMLEPSARVYSFSLGGGVLSQFLVWARYARDAFRPQALVVVITQGYHYSLVEHARMPGYHYFADRGGGRLALERIDYTPGLAIRLARRSALARYLRNNARLPWTTRPSVDPRNEPAATDRLIADSKRASDAFLEMLPEYSGLGPERVAFVIDGRRSQLYEAIRLETEARRRLEDAMRRNFLVNAGRRGYEILDLHPRMSAHYEEHGQKFEWPRDGHWNALGHELCFDAVSSSALLSDVFPRP